MSMKGGGRGGRGGRGGGRGSTRHKNDYGRQHHHHHHHMSQQQQAHVLGADTNPDGLQQAAGAQAIDPTTGAAILADPTATGGPYAGHGHYAPAPPTQFQYTTFPTYFTPQGTMIHAPHASAVPGQPVPPQEPSLYVSIYNPGTIYNCGYIYPSVMNDYHFVPAGEEVPADGRQSADGTTMMQPLWHPHGIYADEYGMGPDMGAIPIGDEYNQASSLGSAETMSPNYALYEPAQITELAHQMDGMQLYEEPQPIDDAAIHAQHVIPTMPTVVSAAALMPQVFLFI